ncbi:MAG: formate dehydrogenase accessory sulfurtransferase FdhD [Candidatus Cloacimonetes bacterium]|nr:formate dehydrogenase accessory sulfurtransferase FdhD [Candidatus Cloacimonadota bacterium]
MDNQRYLTEILRYYDNAYHLETDIVIKELSLSLIINGYRFTTLACLDNQLKELGIGFLFSEGLLTKASDIKEVNLCDKRTRLEIDTNIKTRDLEKYLSKMEQTTGCGGGISGELSSNDKRPFQKISLDLSLIPDLMFNFQQQSILFKETGGVHSAALGIKDNLVFFAEDIGRHNAVDKVIGAAMFNNKNMSDYYLLISGRISSEIVRKVIRLRIPLIISQAAPTSKAISLAWQNGIYLIGFARGKRFNVYTGLNEIKKQRL